MTKDSDACLRELTTNHQNGKPALSSSKKTSYTAVKGKLIRHACTSYA